LAYSDNATCGENNDAAGLKRRMKMWKKAETTPAKKEWDLKI